MATMGADVELDPDVAVFLDTSLVIAATVEVHPSHKVASDRRLATRNASDFKRFHEEVSILAVTG